MIKEKNEREIVIAAEDDNIHIYLPSNGEPASIFIMCESTNLTNLQIDELIEALTFAKTKQL